MEANLFFRIWYQKYDCRFNKIIRDEKKNIHQRYSYWR